MRSARVGIVGIALVLSTAPTAVLAQSTEQLVQQANTAREARRFPEAEAIWQQIIKRDPQNAEAHRNLCNVLDDQDNKIDAAVTACQKAVKLDSTNAENHFLLGYVLQKQKHLHEAIDAYRQAIKLKPEARSYNNLGNALKALDRFDEAIDAYHQAIKLKPEARSYNNLGNALKALDRFDEAIDAYRRAIHLDSKYAKAYYNLGNALKAKKRFDEAINAYRQAVQLDPKYTKAYSKLCDVMDDQLDAQSDVSDVLDGRNKIDEAIDACRQAVQSNPKDAENHFLLGYVLAKDQKLDEAIKEYHQAINIDPKNANAYNELGNALADQKNLDEAIKAYRQATNIDPKDATFQYNLGNALADQKKPDEAIKAYKVALTLPDSPGPPTTDHVLAHNGLGLVYKQQRNLKVARQEFEQAVNLDPSYKFAQNNLAATLKLLEIPDTPSFNATPYFPSSDPDAHLHRATVYIDPYFSHKGSNDHGTGFVIKRQGNTLWILTARHVVVDGPDDDSPSADRVDIQFYQGDKILNRHDPVQGKILKMTPSNDDSDDSLDLALLKVTVPGLPEDIQPLTPNPDPTVGLLTRTIGYPENKPSTVTKGEVIDTRGKYITLRIPFKSGNSGGPVLDEENHVIGIADQVRQNETGFAIPMRKVMQILESWGISLP